MSNIICCVAIIHIDVFQKPIIYTKVYTDVS